MIIKTSPPKFQLYTAHNSRTTVDNTLPFHTVAPCPCPAIIMTSTLLALHLHSPMNWNQLHCTLLWFTPLYCTLQNFTSLYYIFYFTVLQFTNFTSIDCTFKNPAYWRHWLSWHVRLIALLQETKHKKSGSDPEQFLVFRACPICNTY